MKSLRVVFLTGTRADYGKLKSLMKICDDDPTIDTRIFAIGMHLLREYGKTVDEVLADGYKDVYYPDSYIHHNRMELNLAETIEIFSDYVNIIKPDLIVVHGDRVEPLAGAIVGVMNNIKVAHIEGGEVTGTADEFMRHAISKLSNLHFVSNEEAKYRLLQLGEHEENIHVIGSPDIDVMLSISYDLPHVKVELGIDFESFSILIYHPVTSSENLSEEISQVVSAVLETGDNFIVIMPNNDHGNEIIKKEYEKLQGNHHFTLFSSIGFEGFLTLLKYADYIIGNSSAGVREACVYGVPAIDIGSRQSDRYNPDAIRNIQHCDEVKEDILACIRKTGEYRNKSLYFGDGQSAGKFLKIIKRIDNVPFQKSFVELNQTSDAIANYINEVCF